MSHRINRIKEMIRSQDWFAFFIELIIVVLGITIAYQLNIYQQNSANKKIEKALLEKLRIENQQNLTEIENIAETAFNMPNNLNRYLKMLDKLALDQLEESSLNKDSLAVYFNSVVSSYGFPIKDQYLITYLNKSSEIGNGDLAPELLKLQSLYNNILFFRSTLLDYRVNHIWSYTDQAYDRDTQIYNLEYQTDNTFRMRLFKLANIEAEQTSFLKETITQIRKIDKMLDAYK